MNAISVAVVMEKCHAQSWTVVMVILERMTVVGSAGDWQGEGFVGLTDAPTSLDALLRTAPDSEKWISLMHHVLCRYTVDRENFAHENICLLNFRVVLFSSPRQTGGVASFLLFDVVFLIFVIIGYR